jgi:hypothetical protein
VGFFHLPDRAIAQRRRVALLAMTACTLTLHRAGQRAERALVLSLTTRNIIAQIEKENNNRSSLG